MSREDLLKEAQGIAQSAGIFCNLEPDQQIEAIEYVAHDLEEYVYGNN